MTNYITLLKTCLTDAHRIGQIEYKELFPTTWKMRVLKWFDTFLRKYNFAITKVHVPTYQDRLYGRDHPAYADTMIGIKRLDNIQYCTEMILKDGIEGDFIECGVWRGGACIFMRALLNELGAHDRWVWVADSFEGLPAPELIQDKGSTLHTRKELAINLDQVIGNFRKYGMWNPDRVKIEKGFFEDTLPNIEPVVKFALIRLDGDMYSSTMDCLTNLYPKLSVGGYCIIDDWNLKGARQAVLDYFKDELPEIKVIDENGVYWKKTNPTP